MTMHTQHITGTKHTVWSKYYAIKTDFFDCQRPSALAKLLLDSQLIWSHHSDHRLITSPSFKAGLCPASPSRPGSRVDCRSRGAPCSLQLQQRAGLSSESISIRSGVREARLMVICSCKRKGKRGIFACLYSYLYIHTWYVSGYRPYRIYYR